MFPYRLEICASALFVLAACRPVLAGTNYDAVFVFAPGPATLTMLVGAFILLEALRKKMRRG
jgi:hypothetical protein